MGANQVIEHFSLYHDINVRLAQVTTSYIDGNIFTQGYVVEPVDKVLHVAEKGHQEVRQIKKAWAEKIKIKESGWYRTVVHAAETAKIKTVYQAAYSYEEPVYEPYVLRVICNECGADITEDAEAHNDAHALDGSRNNRRGENRQVQTGVKVVNIPEQSHYETQVVKEAWVEYVGLTYHEAGDKITVHHPAETELVWVVDEPAHQETKTEVKSVYHYRVCQGCGAVGDGWTAEQIKNHDWKVHGIEPGTSIRPFGKPKSGNVIENVVTILNVAEKGHYEVKVIKEAWEEEVTIAQSGWYKTVTHPAETAQAKVIDKAAYYYEEPVYEYKYPDLCWGCDAEVGNNVMTDNERLDHMTEHHNRGEISGYRQVMIKTQVGTNKYDVPEVSHNETVTTKKAYSEIVFVMDK